MKINLKNKYTWIKIGVMLATGVGYATNAAATVGVNLDPRVEVVRQCAPMAKTILQKGGNRIWNLELENQFEGIRQVEFKKEDDFENVDVYNSKQWESKCKVEREKEDELYRERIQARKNGTKLSQID